ncbi:MAG: PAS domain-containing sensor histidine kinase, partial [Chitinophagaceae bacterium]
LRILEANEATSIQYGYGLDELKSMPIKKLIHPDMEERLNAVARSSRHSSKFRTSYLTRHIDREGRVMHMEVAFHPIDYFGSRASMAIVKNITDQVELERRLEKERELKQQEVTLAAVTAQEQERLHIGRELHDNINQILATVRLYIEYALSNPAMHDQLLKSAKELVMSAVNEIRDLSKSLLPPTVGEKGLAAALDDLFNSIRKINKYSFHTNWNMDEDRLPENLKLTIFRIIQEQLNNIFKHARAKKIDASITMNNDRLVLKMRDDGRGFDPAVNGKGVGLKNIRSRAELHKGSMNLKTTEGKGTELTVSFNLQL